MTLPQTALPQNKAWPDESHSHEWVSSLVFIVTNESHSHDLRTRHDLIHEYEWWDSFVTIPQTTLPLVLFAECGMAHYSKIHLNFAVILSWANLFVTHSCVWHDWFICVATQRLIRDNISLTKTKWPQVAEAPTAKKELSRSEQIEIAKLTKKALKAHEKGQGLSITFILMGTVALYSICSTGLR